MRRPHNTRSSSTDMTAGLIGEATTFRADTEALHATAGGLAALRLPTPVGLPSPGATGDGVLDAVLGEFCRRYNQLVKDTASDHGAAIGHLRGTATDYAATEAAITRSVVAAFHVPTTPSEHTTPEPPRPAHT